MELWSIGILIIGIAVLVVAVVAVPALIQFNKTLMAAESFMKSMKTLVDDEVSPMVRSINDTMQEVDEVVKAARDGVEKIDDALDSLKGVGNTVRSINNIIDTKVKGTLIDVIAYAVGVKSGLGYLLGQAGLFKNKEVA